MRIGLGIAALSFLLVGVVAACSDEDTLPPPPPPPTCNEAPFTCPDGQTCWVVGSQAAPAFECLNSGPKGRGEACQLTFGQPQCGDDLVCWAVMNDPNVCTPYCDPTDVANMCPDGLQCLEVGIPSATKPLTFFACRPEMGAGGAGGAGGGGVGGGGGAAGGAGGGGAGGGGAAGGAGGGGGGG